mmetsp:Transcript_12882/g.28072  ORF Transcript_12882/g.28072 Transcript_12882/m.28072 type:complete len:299 (+) Transcript_12882:212-1108(+)
MKTNDVETLMAEHKDGVDKLKDALKTVPDGYDDLCLLRYVLSMGSDVAKAVAAVRKAVEFREKNDSWLSAARDDDAVPPENGPITEYVKVGRHKRTNDGSVVFIVRSGISRPSDAISVFSHETLLRHQTFYAEQNYWMCDKFTRASGKLTKVISINDMTGISLTSGHTDRRFMKIVGENSHQSEFLHPQMLAKMVVYNPPGIFKILFNIGKMFISQKTIEKMAVCPGGASMKKLKTSKDCPAASALFDPKNLPTFLGGECTCADLGLAGCIANVSNDQRTQIPLPASHQNNLQKATKK